MKHTIILAACLAAALVGCGGDDDGSLDCSEFAACGGDPVGQWTIVDACLDGDLQPDIDGCPEATGTIEDVVVSGSVELRDDGSYANNTSSMGTVVLTVPMSCLDGATCEQLSQAAGVPCSENGDACDCQQDFDDSSQESGSWESSGSTITLTDSDGNVNDVSYCVEGDVLKAQQEPDAADDPRITLVMTR